MLYYKDFMSFKHPSSSKNFFLKTFKNVIKKLPGEN